MKKVNGHDATPTVTREERLMAIDYLRVHAHLVSNLRAQGDKDAIGLYDAYVAFHADQQNPQLQYEWVRRTRAFIERDVTVTERRELQKKYGHRAPKS